MAWLLDPLACFKPYRRMCGGRWVEAIHPLGFAWWMRAPKHLDSWEVNENWDF